MCSPSSATIPVAFDPKMRRTELQPAETPNSITFVPTLPLWISTVPRPRMPGPPPPERKITLANTCPDFTTNRPSDPLYLPTSKLPLTVSDGPSRTRDARLLLPSATLRWLTITFVCANVTWPGFSFVPLTRASVVRDGSVPPHMAASSQLPLPSFHSPVVAAHNAVAPAKAAR